MRVLIIEDEPRAANQLKGLLEKNGLSYELLDIIDSVEDAVKWLDNNPSPDLIFMDIQLADGLSFEIFTKVEVDVPIIFTTAFDQYAIQAFKVNSVDYLLKPIQQEDLAKALNKFNKTQTKSGLDSGVLDALLSGLQKPSSRSGILVKDGSGYTQLKVNKLLYVYSESSITFGVTIEKRFVVDETLDQLYDTLDPTLFFKINRGQVIAKNAIIKIQPYLNHRLKLELRNARDQEFIVSRQRTVAFKQWINS